MLPDAAAAAVVATVIRRTVFGKWAWSHRRAIAEIYEEVIERLSLPGLLCLSRTYPFLLCKTTPKWCSSIMVFS